MLKCSMRYKIPTDGEAVDLLTDNEMRFHKTEADAIRRGRQKAWEQHKLTGPVGRLRDLACSELGASILFTDYKSTSALSRLLAYVSLSEGVQFTSKLERSLVDGAIVGVRVTLAAFTR